MQKCTGVQVVLCESIDEICTCLSCAFQISCSFFLLFLFGIGVDNYSK